MGWPRKDDTLRLYREDWDKSYILILTANGRGPGGAYDAVANVHNGPEPSLGSTVVHPIFLLKHCTRVQWDELPPEWQTALKPWFDGRPAAIRGLWRVGCQPSLPRKPRSGVAERSRSSP